MFVSLVGSTLLLAAGGPTPLQACAYDEAKEVLIATSTAQTKFEAGANPVFQAGTFDFGGETYEMFGNPRPFTPAELKPYAKMGAAMLFIDTEFNEEILYVLVSSAGCKFQPFARKKRDTRLIFSPNKG
jgi:hypothetical protein